MRDQSISYVTCRFCGRRRREITVSDDGYDWEGHHRGTAYQDTHLEKCFCDIGQLVGKLPEVKPMCVNCKFYKNMSCTNPEKIKEVTFLADNFDIKVNNLSVKNPGIACEKHVLDYGIFSDLFEDAES